MKPVIFTNARLVLRNEIITGSLAVETGFISAVDQGSGAAVGGIDCEGDYLLPGLIELHTDNMEKYFAPRPGVIWPSVAAALAHDAQMAASGITTVFDAVAVGYELAASIRKEIADDIIAAITQTQQAGLTRAEHFLHLRCEVSNAEAAVDFERYASNPRLRLVSLMDHAPGQRQFADLARYRAYYQGKYGYDDRQMEIFIYDHQENSRLNAHRNRDCIAQICWQRRIPLASHDDASAAHVQEAIGYRSSIAEFPTTLEAAKLSHENHLMVLMGAPNLIRGQSHSGNVSAALLAEHACLDGLSSDYYPSSLLPAAFKLAALETNHYTLADAIGCITWRPAKAVGLHDRGDIQIGKRADLIRVRLQNGIPLIREVWRAGERVH